MRTPLRPTSHATERAAALQSAHESIVAAQVKTKVWLELGGEFMMGDGGLHLLQGIVQHGSLAQAVREIGWSYRHAWGYLRRAETALKTSIVRNRPGRGAARGMELTETGLLSSSGCAPCVTGSTMRSARAGPLSRRWPHAGVVPPGGLASVSGRRNLGEEFAEPEPRPSSTHLMSSLGLTGHDPGVEPPTR